MKAIRKLRPTSAALSRRYLSNSIPSGLGLGSSREVPKIRYAASADRTTTPNAIYQRNLMKLLHTSQSVIVTLEHSETMSTCIQDPQANRSLGEGTLLEFLQGDHVCDGKSGSAAGAVRLEHS